MVLLLVGEDYSLKVFENLQKISFGKLGISQELNDVVTTRKMVFLQKKWNQMHFHVIFFINFIIML